MRLFNKKDVPAEEIEESLPIGTAEIRKAAEILRRYKAGKATLENKLIENEEYWRQKQWRVRGKSNKEFNPATAILWDCIESRHADAMDYYPTCNLRPRAGDDTDEAKMLTSVLPVILDLNDFEETYSNVVRYALIHGTIAYGVFWDPTAMGGLGDVSVRPVDLLNLFWEPGITDIQRSSNVFHVDLVDNAILESRYPQVRGNLKGNVLTVSHYVYDDHVDTTGKSVVVDWYYHTEIGGKRQLQYCKFVGDNVLYSTENDNTVPMRAEVDPVTGNTIEVPAGLSPRDRGHYDHGEYPFVITPLYPVAGTICGKGLTDVGRDTQDEIDSLNKAVVKNAVIAAKPRYFYRRNCNINLEEYRNLDNDFVAVDGSLDEMNVRRIEAENVSGNVISVLQHKIDELKLVTANQDVLNGGVPTGVTSAAGIAALQESGGKRARNANKTFHRAYRTVIKQVIELIRQFYDVPRQFRITGGEVAPVDKFVTYSNVNLKGQPMYGEGGAFMGLRLPEFDIEVTTEKDNPYKKLENNELALQFYNLGFFNPGMGDQAISCLQMMDFDRKDEILSMVGQNATLFKMMTQYQSIALGLAERYEPETAEQLSQIILGQGGQAIPQPIGDVELSHENEEHPSARKAREAARASTGE